MKNEKSKKSKFIFWFKLIVILVIVVFLWFLFGRSSVGESERMNSINTKFNPLNSHSIETIRFIDPQISNLVCYISSAKMGGIKGAVGVAEDVSDMSLSCVIKGNKANINGDLNGSEVVYKESRNITFKTLKVVRNFDEQNNIIYYVAYSDKVLDGDSTNATSAVWLGDNNKAVENEKK